MNFRLLTATTALGGVFLLAAALPNRDSSPGETDQVRPAGISIQDPDQDDDETQLGLYMQGVNRHLKALRSGLEAEDAASPAKLAEMVAIARDLQVLFARSRNEQPERVAEIAEGERAEWLKAFQVVLIDNSRLALDLEVALLDGAVEKAEELRGELNSSKRPGHRKFK